MIVILQNVLVAGVRFPYISLIIVLIERMSTLTVIGVQKNLERMGYLKQHKCLLTPLLKQENMAPLMVGKKVKKLSFCVMILKRTGYT